MGQAVCLFVLAAIFEIVGDSSKQTPSTRMHCVFEIASGDAPSGNSAARHLGSVVRSEFRPAGSVAKLVGRPVDSVAKLSGKRSVAVQPSCAATCDAARPVCRWPRSSRLLLSILPH